MVFSLFGLIWFNLVKAFRLPEFGVPNGRPKTELFERPETRGRTAFALSLRHGFQLRQVSTRRGGAARQRAKDDDPAQFFGAGLAVIFGTEFSRN